MFCFHLNEIAAIEIIVTILCVAFTTIRDIPVIGKTAGNVKTILCPRCMFITAQMNTILRRCSIYRTMSLLDVQSVTQ